MPAFPLIGPAYTERSKDLNAQTCVNLYPVTGGPGGKNVLALYGTPGLIRRAYLGADTVRGMHELNGLLYGVAGNTLWEMDAGLNATAKGTLSTGTGRVSMADNGNVLMICDGTKGYFFDGTTLTAITDTQMPDATQVVFLDGYFIFDDPANEGRFFRSSAYADDATAMVDGLDWATAESNPDRIVSIVAHGGHLYLLGGDSIEAWYHSGEEFPFNPVGGARSERGCAAKWSIGHTPDAILYLAQDHNGGRQVVLVRGFRFDVVSTPAIEFALEGYGTISDAIGYCYTQEGHTYYVLTFPTEDATWVYDLSTQMWHRRAGWFGGEWTRHRGNAYAHFAGMHLLGDYATGKIYEISLDAYDDDGDVLRAERVAPVVHDAENQRRLFFDRLALDMETGVGDSTTTNPKIVLDWSDDGGHVWNGRRDLSFGAQGKYDTRVVAWRLGAARQRNFRVAISDPVKRALIGASLKLRVGSS